MNILSIDVSITGCAIAFLDTKSGEKVLISEETERGQAERLIPMIDELVKESCVKMTDLSRIAVTRGPGSFTGVRIGLSTARTLGMALSVPVIGFSTLDLLLEEYKDRPNLLVAIDTKRGDFYGATAQGEARIYPADDVSCWQGSLIKDARPDLLLMAELAGGIADEAFVLYPPTPLYLREAEVSFPS